MKRTSHQLLLLAFAIGAVVSCDARLPTASRRAVAGTPPAVVLDSPLVNAQINLGDSIFARVSITGGNGLRTLTIGADALSGDKDLGTFKQVPRFATVTVDFPPGTTDTIIRRFLHVLNPGDQTLDSLVIIAVATDSTGLVDSSKVRAIMVSGPHVTITAPTPNDSVPPGVGVSISAQATDADGIGQISIHVTGDPTWPTKLDTIMTQVYNASSLDQTFTGIASIPLDAPARSKITVNANSTDGVRQPGSAAPIVLFIKSAGSISAPRVTQVVPPQGERGDTVQISASGQGIVAVGLIIRDSAGTIIETDSIPIPPPITSNVKIGVQMKLSLAQQGHHLAVTAFAVDQSGRIGYAVRVTQAGSETVLANALADSSTIVFGQTFTMPLAGTVGDVAIDPVRGNVFLSNTTHNRLEVWQNSGKTFAPNGIPVGAEPWGMTVSVDPDTLFVANSAGTNFDRVFIGSATPSALHTVLSRRILTRAVYAFTVTMSVDAVTGKVTLAAQGPIQYSDRPQYIAQTSNGRIYFSTQPTSAATPGTIRWLDPGFPVPDPHLIWEYGGITSGANLTYAVFNIDSLGIFAFPPTSKQSDILVLYDHHYGQNDGVTVTGTDSTVDGAVQKLNAKGSDAEHVLRLDLASINLTDTTFVATSTNRHWVAFGEGHKTGIGRVMMAADSLPLPLPPLFSLPNFFSPLVTVTDLTDNASEQVFGLALDKFGKTVASHGLKSYFSTVDVPFHLRLQGKYDSFDNGAGIALHPDADGQNSPQDQRLAFVASSSGQIEIVDIAYFINRGSIQLKNPIYGPLRVSQPMPGDNTGKVCPGDPTCIILKLFAITARGLIVIDLTKADIKDGPP